MILFCTKIPSTCKQNYQVHVHKIPSTCIQKYHIQCTCIQNTKNMYTKIPSTCIQKYHVHVHKNTKYMYTKKYQVHVYQVYVHVYKIPSTCIQNTKYMHTKYQVHVYKIPSTCIQNIKYMYTKIPSTGTCIQKYHIQIQCTCIQKYQVHVYKKYHWFLIQIQKTFISECMCSLEMSIFFPFYSKVFWKMLIVISHSFSKFPKSCLYSLFLRFNLHVVLNFKNASSL